MALSRTDSSSHLAQILLVDDNSLGLSARKVVLEELGHQVTTAGSPNQAKELLSERRFDLVITDFKMPDMTGAELIGWMRDRGLETPSILISGFADALGLTEANTGADIVIQKSAHEVGHMLRAVKSILKRAVKKPAGADHPMKPKIKRVSSS
jgi:CheY-like chemotaxis protein